MMVHKYLTSTVACSILFQGLPLQFHVISKRQHGDCSVKTIFKTSESVLELHFIIELDNKPFSICSLLPLLP